MVTAWADADATVFSAALERVISDAMSDHDPQRACAQLLFGMASLSGILLDELADHTSRTHSQVLTHVHRRYLGTADTRTDDRPG